MPASEEESVLGPANLEEAAGRIDGTPVGQTIVPRGSGSKWKRFDRPDVHTVLSTELLDSVVDYSPNDMTVTVGAGMKLTTLADVLAEHGQRLPLDPPCFDRATVGGVLAANDSGPIRLVDGTARDLVIGMKTVLANGNIVKSGGRVVKNVAGYDLHKLLIGSFGSLGLIGEVTFKVRPIPETRCLVVLKPPDLPEADRMLQRILRGPTRPAGLELLNARAARMLGIDCPLGALLIVVIFEETAEATTWQCEQIVEQFGPASMVCNEDDSATVYEAIREWPGRDAVWSFKATMPGGNVAGFVHQCGWHPIGLLVHAGSGIVYGQCQEEDAAGALTEVQRALGDQGHVVLLCAPPEAQPTRWGPPRSDTRLMRKLKESFDPKGIFVDGPFPTNGGFGCDRL